MAMMKIGESTRGRPFCSEFGSAGRRACAEVDNHVANSQCAASQFIGTPHPRIHPLVGKGAPAMSALTIRLSDDKYERLKALSRRRGTSVNRLIDEMATLLLAEFDAEARFQLRVERGRGQTVRGIELLRTACCAE
jgi:predicted DNA-binding protein